jgi:hypothetical protein
MVVLSVNLLEGADILPRQDEARAVSCLTIYVSEVRLKIDSQYGHQSDDVAVGIFAGFGTVVQDDL